jgi:hypothetical protein
LRVDTGCVDAPLAKWFAYPEMGGDLCRSFSSCPKFHEAVARNEKSCREPVGLLFLFVRVVAEKKQSGLRYFDADRRVE